MRAFTRTQRITIYLRARGRCQRCGAQLEPGWHADHVTPWSRGGMTTIDNGQALCRRCNQAKGSHMSIELRSPQAELVDKMLKGIDRDRPITIGLMYAGSGKTLAYQAAFTDLVYEQEVDLIAVYAPRKSLSEQGELSWSRYRGEFDPQPRRIAASDGNKPPLHKPKTAGYLSTYQALVRDSRLHLDFARRHQGRFLLVLDEAQYAGDSNEDDNEVVTQVGKLLREMAKYARHTLILTGTPYRSDGQQIVLCDDYYVKRNGRWHLKPHVISRYSYGVRDGYLRQLDWRLWQAEIVQQELTGDAEQILSLDDYEIRLTDVLQMPDIYKGLADETMEALLAQRQMHPWARALVACSNIRQAKAVHKHIKMQWPQLSSVIAVSDDRDEAQRTLRDFQRRNHGDVLVSVLMAYIGFDCPDISVVGMLTNVRHEGQIIQTALRAGRVKAGVPFEQQKMTLVTPDDPQMAEICCNLKEDSMQGLRDRHQGEPVDLGAEDGLGEGPAANRAPDVIYVSGKLTEQRAEGNDGEVDTESLGIIDEVARTLDLGHIPADKLSSLVDGVLARRTQTPPPSNGSTEHSEHSSGERSTYQEQMQRFDRDTATLVKRIVTLQAGGSRVSGAEFAIRAAAITDQANKLDGLGFKGKSNGWTLEHAEGRNATMRKLYGKANVNA